MDLADNEQRQNARPELSTKIENLDQYNVIFLDYPNWNADLPQPLYTFLESYDFSGKTIVPFCPHGGSGFSNTISTISKLQPNANVIKDGFAVSRGNVPNSANDVISWIQGLGMERTIDGLRGFTDCLPNAKVKGVIYGEGVYSPGEVKDTQAMQEAYTMGKDA